MDEISAETCWRHYECLGGAGMKGTNTGHNWDANEVAEAAQHLINELDDVVPGWRDDTLNQGDLGDSVNWAWDRLVEAIEGLGS